MTDENEISVTDANADANADAVTDQIAIALHEYDAALSAEDFEGVAVANATIKRLRSLLPTDEQETEIESESGEVFLTDQLVALSPIEQALLDSKYREFLLAGGWIVKGVVSEVHDYRFTVTNLDDASTTIVVRTTIQAIRQPADAEQSEKPTPPA